MSIHTVPACIAVRSHWPKPHLTLNLNLIVGTELSYDSSVKKMQGWSFVLHFISYLVYTFWWAILTSFIYLISHSSAVVYTIEFWCRQCSSVLPWDQLSRNQLPLNQLPIDQLPTGSTPTKSTSHEINCYSLHDYMYKRACRYTSTWDYDICGRHFLFSL